MNASEASPKTAKLLSQSTLIIAAVGLFLAIYFMFTDVEFAIYLATFALVGLIGIVSFLRHSVFYRSDQARMGWHQEQPGFQIEVGFANLAVGIAAIVAVALDLGLLACSMCLLMFGLYLACACGLHAYEFVKSKEEKRRPGKVVNTAFIAVILLAFAVLAMSEAGAI